MNLTQIQDGDCGGRRWTAGCSSIITIAIRWRTACSDLLTLVWPTRRWYYFIPASGEPRALVHRIESGALDTNCPVREDSVFGMD